MTSSPSPAPPATQGQLADELERMHREATPAPWVAVRPTAMHWIGLACVAGLPIKDADRSPAFKPEDADLIARVRTLLPDIIAALRAGAGRPAVSEGIGKRVAARYAEAHDRPDATCPCSLTNQQFLAQIVDEEISNAHVRP